LVGVGRVAFLSGLLPEGCVASALPGAFPGDRTKGNGGVALASSWWLSVFPAVECLTWVSSAVAAIVIERVPRLWLGTASIRADVAGIPLNCGPGSSVRVFGSLLSGTRLWCLVCYPSDPSWNTDQGV